MANECCHTRKRIITWERVEIKAWSIMNSCVPDLFFSLTSVAEIKCPQSGERGKVFFLFWEYILSILEFVMHHFGARISHKNKFKALLSSVSSCFISTLPVRRDCCRAVVFLSAEMTVRHLHSIIHFHFAWNLKSSKNDVFNWATSWPTSTEDDAVMNVML